MLKRKILSTLLVLASCSISLVDDASANPITFSFSGVVTNYQYAGGNNPSDTFGGSIAVGTPFSGTYTFNSNAAGIYTMPVVELAFPSVGAPFGFSVDVGANHFSTNRVTVAVANNIVNTFDPSQPSPIEDVYWAGYTFLDKPSISIGLYDTTALSFDYPYLPLTPPALNGFEGKIFSLNFVESSDYLNDYKVTGEIQTLRQVPEPGSLAMISIGLASLWFIRRRSCTEI